MSVISKVSLGTVNYTNWIRVTAAPVGDENNLVFEEWYDVPGVPFIYITLPSPINYIIKYYDAENNGDTGVLLEPTLIVNGLSPAFQYEERWYKIGDMPGTATLNAAGTEIDDPYLSGKIIDSYFKEGFRFLKETSEITFDDVSKVNLLGGLSISSEERFRIVIQNPVGTVSAQPGAMFAGTVDITIQNYTILAVDKNKRFRLVGGAVSQNITFPSLASLTDNDFIFLDNTVGGVAIQPKVIMPGTDRILYNGWSLSINEFAEFWVSRGETLRLQKYTSGSASYWEVIGDYAGRFVGEKFYNTSRTSPGGIANNNTKYTAAQLPRVAYWGKNILMDKIIDDTVGNTDWARPSDKPGVWAFTSDYSVMRAPDTQNLSVRHLKKFTTFGSDVANRPYDAPGGFQEEMVGPHNHTFNTGDENGISDDANDRNVMVPSTPGIMKNTANNSGTENRVKNVGYIEFTRI